MSRRLIRISLVLMVAPLLQAQAPAAQASAKLQTIPKKPPASRPFSLEAGKQLSNLQAWEKAEEQFLKLDPDASETDRQQALDGINHAHPRIMDDKRAGAFGAARAFERLDRWKDAEQAYVEIIKTDPAAAAKAAVDIEHIAPKITNARWPEVIDEWLLKFGRILLVPTIFYAGFRFYRAVKESRASIKFQPFKASTDDATKQIAFWLESTLANLLSPAPAFPTWPGLVSSLPFMRLPGLREDLELEDLEIGGVKVLFKQLLQTIGVPRARVSGNWYVGAATGSAYVSVDKRKGLGMRYSSSAQQAVASAAGPAQDADLQRFAYAVFIEAAR